MSRIASVAVEKTALHFDKLFDYLLPESWAEQAQVGCRVSVSFGSGGRFRQGMILRLREGEPQGKLKTAAALLDPAPVLSVSMLGVVKQLHATCFCTWYEAVRTVLPAGLAFRVDSQAVYQPPTAEQREQLSPEQTELVRLLDSAAPEEVGRLVQTRREMGDRAVGQLQQMGLLALAADTRRKVGDKMVGMARLADPDAEPGKLPAKQKKLFDFLREVGTASVKEACYLCGCTDVVMKNLVRAGLVELYEREVYRNPYAGAAPTRSLDSVRLTGQQQRAYEGLAALQDEGKACAALLRGVTGSGKTQVFVKLIQRTLAMGKQCLLLVPEISLTPQMLEFFQSLFGEQVAVLHSGLSMGEQLDEYKRIQNGLANIVIGTRSAVFAPCENIGLIIMDEEGEQTYKSADLSPRYHAREIAKYRCVQTNALLLLASATPSIESEYYAETGRYHLFEMTERYGNARLPEVFLIDMRTAPPSQVEGLSGTLAEELVINLERKEQSILLLNRRGYHSSVVCCDCGWVAQCPHCSVALTYHQANRSLMCHYCGHVAEPVQVCPVCGGKHMLYTGSGTQRVEEQLQKILPPARILRMDADTTFTRAALEQKIAAFENGEYDLLVGTQIVAKGLNFPSVTLVGVLAADTLLYGADFRCHEHLFSLLTQVVGRSGRGSRPGRAMIQTYRPDNATILQAARQDYKAFYRDEIAERKSFLCPPFCDICTVTFSGYNEKQVDGCAHLFAHICRERADREVPLQLLGVSTPFIARLSNRYRRRIVIKCRNNPAFRQWMRRIAAVAFQQKNFARVRVALDINGEIT